MTENRSKRGQLILDAAQTLFLQYGYDDTSLEMIINEAGGSRRSIYSEFGNKQGLLMAVLEARVAQQAGTLTEIDMSLSAEQALTIICHKFVSHLISPTMLALFRLVTQLVVKIPEAGELIYEKGPLNGVKPVIKYFEFLEQECGYEFGDKQFAAEMLLEMVQGRLHIKSMLLTNETVSSQEVADHVKSAVKLFLKAYQ